MGAIKQSVCWGCFKRGDVTPEQLIATSKKIGYKSIEMGPREHWQQIKDAGMDIAISVGHGSLGDGLNKRENHDRIEDQLKSNIDTAVEFGIPSLIAFSGNRNGLSDEDGLEICAEGLKRATPYAEEKGITICMELLNSKVNHPDYQCDYTVWGVELCKNVGSDRFKLLYDIYHMQIMEGDLIRNIRDYIDYIGHFHTAGNPGR
ncbi:MAG: TIM barrel protein, partial [Candidatus Poribacteria bacterium]|nr:TIM barrel protein [Candidatus Poribacteria bacterium]